MKTKVFKISHSESKRTRKGSLVEEAMREMIHIHPVTKLARMLSYVVVTGIWANLIRIKKRLKK